MHLPLYCRPVPRVTGKLPEVGGDLYRQASRLPGLTGNLPSPTDSFPVRLGSDLTLRAGSQPGRETARQQGEADRGAGQVPGGKGKITFTQFHPVFINLSSFNNAGRLEAGLVAGNDQRAITAR